MDASVVGIEAFRLCAGGGRQVLVCFVLPVCPAEQFLVGYISHLADLSDAFLSVHARSKLADDKRDPEPFGIGLPSVELALMIVLALLRESSAGLSGLLADRGVKCATVRMLV